MTELILENRPLKKNDPVTIVIQFKKGQKFGPFLIDSTVYNYLEKVPTIAYVYKLSKDGHFCFLKKNKKGKGDEIMIPTAFFKVVKVPKMNDVVTWLYDNQVVTFPEQWRIFKSDIQSVSRYIPKIFQTNLKAIYLVNKNCNHLYFNNDPFEVLMFYKTIVQQLGLTFHGRYNKFPTLSIRKQFIDAVLKIDPSWHRLDAISIYDLNNRNVFSNDEYMSNKDRLGFYKDPKKYQKSDEAVNHIELMKEFDKRDLTKIDKNDKRFIHELNQSVIDELELVIFNVKSLPNRNQILFIFIDKDNNKRFFVEQFSFVFYVSNKTSIIQNDYIEDYDEASHKAFIVQNFEVLRNLKFAVNESHKKFMKRGQF